MTAGEARHQMREQLVQWQARLEQLRTERKAASGAARRAYLARLRELQAKIADEIQAWNAGIDEYDEDPGRTTQREFDERPGLHEIEREIAADVAAWTREEHGVG